MASGDLTTKSTYEKMAKTLVVNPSTLAMSPSGKLLAVAGNRGLDLFHFNVRSPITHYGGLLSTRSFTAPTPSPVDVPG